MIESIICFTQILVCVVIVVIAIQIKYVRDEVLREIHDIFDIITSQRYYVGEIFREFHKDKKNES